MIYADFLTLPEGELVGFRIAGHSEYSEMGTDIVCAAVSSAFYMAINTITEVIGINPLALRVSEGEVFFRTENKDEPNCRTILKGFKLHLQNLEEQYQDYIRVSYLEV